MDTVSVKVRLPDGDLVDGEASGLDMGLDLEIISVKVPLDESKPPFWTGVHRSRITVMED